MLNTVLFFINNLGQVEVTSGCVILPYCWFLNAIHSLFTSEGYTFLTQTRFRFSSSERYCKLILLALANIHIIRYEILEDLFSFQSRCSSKLKITTDLNN